MAQIGRSNLSLHYWTGSGRPESSQPSASTREQPRRQHGSTNPTFVRSVSRLAVNQSLGGRPATECPPISAREEPIDSHGDPRSEALLGTLLVRP